ENSATQYSCCIPNTCRFKLLDVVRREETLLNVIRSVTKNGRSILLTALLALIILYIYAILGFVFFKDDFQLEVESIGIVRNLTECDVGTTELSKSEENPCANQSEDPETVKERHCDSLRMCILTTLHEGLRNGGGIADVLRRPSIQVRGWWVLNRLQRASFEQCGVSFDDHIQRVHNIWHYINFVIYLMLKPISELTGPESYVRQCLSVSCFNTDFPHFAFVTLVSRELLVIENW
ncbi:Inositol 1 4 5-trisphosphate receptor type 1, partial [Fasciolopsis buskii]